MGGRVVNVTDAQSEHGSLDVTGLVYACPFRPVVPQGLVLTVSKGRVLDSWVFSSECLNFVVDKLTLKRGRFLRGTGGTEDLVRIGHEPLWSQQKEPVTWGAVHRVSLLPILVVKILPLNRVRDWRELLSSIATVNTLHWYTYPFPVPSSNTRNNI